MKLSDFDYELPPELIAQHPTPERDAARLLVHDVASQRTVHSRVRELDEWLEPGDLLVVNDTRVLSARLHGRRRSGGRVELFFLEPTERDERIWRAMANPARKLKEGEQLQLEGGALVARLVQRPPQADGRPGLAWEVQLFENTETAASDPAPPADPTRLLQRYGHVPLPPYIRRAMPGQGSDGAPADEVERDRERYQTVFAREPGAVAAPTAGLHFTPELLDRLQERGVERASVTLHVGPGTFQPVKCEDIEEHRMHSERYVLPEATVEAVAQTRARGGRVVAVGTTSVRVLEGAVREGGALVAGAGATELFLRPGSRFRVVDALFTNFHLPQSSLLMLVSAFAGRERVLDLYRLAIAQRYRFFSYGDAMLLFGDRSPDEGP